MWSCGRYDGGTFVLSCTRTDAADADADAGKEGL